MIIIETALVRRRTAALPCVFMGWYKRGVCNYVLVGKGSCHSEFKH